MQQEIKERIELINKGIVPAGYKKTHVGICPIEWDASFIGEITKQPSYGLNKSATTNEKYPKYIRITDIDNNGKYLYSNAHVDCSDNNYFLHYGDIVFARTGATCGKNYLYDPRDGDLVFAGFLIKFSADQSKILPSLLFYNCNTNNFWKYVNICSQRSGQPGLNIDDIQKFKINITKNLLEQQKIAEILDCATRQVELQEQLIDKLKIQKKALMQKLLTPQPDWQEVKLGDVVTYASSGGTPKTDFEEYYNGNIVWVSIDDITKCQKYIENSSRKITDLGLKNSSTKLLNPNTILFAMYASIGKCAISKVLCTTSQAILGLVANEKKVGYEYLYYTLCFMEDSLKLLGQKGSQSNLNKQMVLNFNVFLPNLKEQNEITNILKNIDKQIELQQKLLEQYKLRKKALMQLLLTGIVRVC